MRMAARQGRALHASATAAVATAAAVTGGNNACGDQARSGGQVETQTANRRRVDNGKKTPKTSEADCQKSLEAAAAALTALITRVAALEKRNSALVRTHASARAPAVMHAAVVATAPHRSASPTSSTEGCIGRRSPR
ncbi:hypothetical protein Vretimale_10949 [Volvox reticuliferus]|nr:hypothetical protein Vretimale_10949 [Volvox reticuliferus]